MYCFIVVVVLNMCGNDLINEINEIKGVKRKIDQLAEIAAIVGAHESPDLEDHYDCCKHVGGCLNKIVYKEMNRCVKHMKIDFTSMLCMYCFLDKCVDHTNSEYISLKDECELHGKRKKKYIPFSCSFDGCNMRSHYKERLCVVHMKQEKSDLLCPDVLAKHLSDTFYVKKRKNCIHCLEGCTKKQRSISDTPRAVRCNPDSYIPYRCSFDGCFSKSHYKQRLCVLHMKIRHSELLCPDLLEKYPTCSRYVKTRKNCIHCQSKIIKF